MFDTGVGIHDHDVLVMKMHARNSARDQRRFGTEAPTARSAYSSHDHETNPVRCRHGQAVDQVGSAGIQHQHRARALAGSGTGLLLDIVRFFGHGHDRPGNRYVHTECGGEVPLLVRVHGDHSQSFACELSGQERTDGRLTDPTLAGEDNPRSLDVVRVMMRCVVLMTVMA